MALAACYAGDMQGPLKEALLVGLGEELGALLRAALVAVIPGSAALATLGINAAGSFAMGYFKPGPFLGTGALGGFTTFSAMTVAAATSSAIWALGIIAVSFIVCVGAWLLADATSPHHYRTQARP